MTKHVFWVVALYAWAMTSWGFEANYRIHLQHYEHVSTLTTLTMKQVCSLRAAGNNYPSTQRTADTPVAQRKHSAHLRQQCHNSKFVIFQERLLKDLKCYNFLWVQRRYNCTPAASFANWVITLHLLKVNLQTFLSIPITQKPNFELWHSCLQKSLITVLTLLRICFFFDYFIFRIHYVLLMHYRFSIQKWNDQSFI